MVLRLRMHPAFSSASMELAVEFDWDRPNGEKTPAIQTVTRKTKTFEFSIQGLRLAGPMDSARASSSFSGVTIYLNRDSCSCQAAICRNAESATAWVTAGRPRDSNPAHQPWFDGRSEERR